MVNDKTWRVRLDGTWLENNLFRPIEIERELEDYTHEVPGATCPHLRPTGRLRVVSRGRVLTAIGADGGGWREPGDWLVIE